MTIRKYLEKNDFIENIDLDYGRYASIRIGFVNSDDDDDETEFDVDLKKMVDDEGQELADLFDNFCEENDFKSNKVDWMEIVAQADSMDELEENS